MNPAVDFYFSKSKKWQQELEQLRRIVLDCGLNEELKWGVPCYIYPVGASPSVAAITDRAFHKSNIVLIHVLKEYCALLFFKGALLKDANNILIQQTKNVQSARQVRFTNVSEIVKVEHILKAYIYEAIAIEKAGLKVNFNERTALAIAVEFQNKLIEMPALKIAFMALTPGRQRAYNLYFSAAMQSKTRAARVEKCTQQILDGKGLNDF